MILKKHESSYFFLESINPQYKTMEIKVLGKIQNVMRMYWKYRKLSSIEIQFSTVFCFPRLQIQLCRSKISKQVPENQSTLSKTS